MKSNVSIALLTGLFTSTLATLSLAAPPAGAPAGTMGICKDGTYSSSAEKKGACRGHKGVQEWYEEAAAPATPPAPGGPRAAPTTPSMAAPTPAPAPVAATKPTPPAMAGRTSGPATEPAPGGGAGKVWANSSSKVYHCSGDKYYGTTKHGEYMSESDAKTKGYHADHGKACA